MQLNGKEIQGMTTTEMLPKESIQTEEQEKKNIITLTTPLGDNIHMEVSGINRSVQTETSKLLWQIAASDYILLPQERLVYLPPNIYWSFYKKYPRGKEMLKGTCTKLFINDQSYRFPETGFYFSNKIADLTVSGVYGIYLDNELLYIGSSSDMITRWKQHNEGFRNGSKLSPMYSLVSDSDRIIYKTLLTREEIETKMGIQNPSMWLIELAEFCYINALQPKYKVAGKTSPFIFQAKPQPEDFPPSYWEVVKRLLLLPELEK